MTVWMPTLPCRIAACVAPAFLVLSSCGNQALQPTDRTAVVAAGQWGKVYRGGYVEVASINGSAPGWRLRSDAEVSPGKVSLIAYVYLCRQAFSHCDSIAEAPLALNAEAGHKYRLLAREQVNGSNRFWVWVVEENTAAVVGGTPPP